MSKSTPGATAPLLDLSTEVIVYTPYSSISEYQGTRAALEAEGIIPAGTDWPEGFNDLRWEDSRFYYLLRRERPEGAKGPRKQFLTVDWWGVRFDPRNSESGEARNIKLQAEKLARLTYLASDKGRREWHANCDRYCEAQTDKLFQSFRAACGIVERKRGRRPKSSVQAQGAAA